MRTVRIGPDPLEHWGEALVCTGQYREAIEKYNAAQRYAPNWAQLYLHWGRGARRGGVNTARQWNATVARSSSI